MTISIWNILIPALAGLIGVAIGSIKPLLDWNIEKRRLRFEERKRLLHEFRMLVISDTITQAGIVNSISYSRLRPKLSKQLTEKFEKQYEPKYPSNLRDWMTIALIDELHEIEKEWGLI